MTDWGVCCTLKAPAEQMLAFVAHHRAVGTAHIWLHFDDPNDAAVDLAATLPGVTAIRCDDVWWRRGQGRPDKHQVRQTANIGRLYDQAPLPWLLHADVDEFLLADRPLAEVFGTADAQLPFLRIKPLEALHEPGLPDDIQTARHFRAALPGSRNAANREQVFGRYAGLLPNGALSHSAGKCLFRTGVPGLKPRIHGAFQHGERLAGEFHPDLALLHFHAQDRTDWLARLPFRLTRGAYQFNSALAGFLSAATEAELADFYDAIQVATPEMLETLKDIGALRTADLHLRDKVAALTGVSR